MKIKLFFLTVLFLHCLAIPGHAYTEKNTAVVRIMNKAAGKAQTINLPVGKSITFEKLTITVNSCKQTDPFAPEDFFMFTQISNNSKAKIFSGWMSANDPGANPLQNPDYDLWLLRCE